MQKILKRVATAERVAAKRKATRDRLHFNKDRKEEEYGLKSQAHIVAHDIGRAKQAIRDDWRLGPLAPNSHTGEAAAQYGAISEIRYKNPTALRKEQKEARCAWLGGYKNLNLAAGDRVVLLHGPEKGRIGRVQDINHDDASVVVEGLNKSNIKLPSAFTADETSPSVLNIELPVPISGVRLVHPIFDPKTGITRDVIINQLVSRGFVHDRITGKAEWTRVVPGMNITIPWPKEEDKAVVDHKIDTLRIDAEERTFVPTLLRPPMPETVIDELRGKYSKFRTRHEPEYIERLEAQNQAVKDRVHLMDSMRSPLQELHRAERASKKKKGKPRLTLEMLEEIGKVIAKNRQRTLDAAGVSDAATQQTISHVPESSTESTAPPPPSV
ncbi:KOW domain-containing protein domain-containing protein [Apiospora kogelbergensis]|uniref:KOW domain-containing protein domain-containing protein n=1 Tax=Apiospora kogelbergensis TaxID=1337665 RepID=A0AAW0R8W1_9PEZI